MTKKSLVMLTLLAVGFVSNVRAEEPEILNAEVQEVQNTQDDKKATIEIPASAR